MPDAWFSHHPSSPESTLVAGGVWQLSTLATLIQEIDALLPQITTSELCIECDTLKSLDTSGAWLLQRTLLRLEENGTCCQLKNISLEHQALLTYVQEYGQQQRKEKVTNAWLANSLVSIGQSCLFSWNEALRFIAFLGHMVTTTGRVFKNPALMRVTATLHHMEMVGIRALPIVSLTAFLIGVVIAYQGATLLKQFGANIFIVDLVAVSILRELGILITAIIVAGRSGSAFTAQIGMMKVNEEIDAMRTMGLDPMIVLLLPRLLALILTLPLLTFIADFAGLAGGALISWITLDINPILFVQQLQTVIAPSTFYVGIIKAPVFAAVIALVGCFCGFQVSGNAESVGRRTTTSVVLSIFLVIIMDAVFSIFFSEIDF